MNRIQKVFFLTVLVSSLFYSNRAMSASFDKYAPKLLKFEGAGFGIHKPIWGEKDFSKGEALGILKKNYWNRYHGDAFESQEMAEALIDHLINAGPGKDGENIKAFEAIIGAKRDGILTLDDVKRANSFYFAEQVVNPYIKYRILYYKSRRDAHLYPGWIVRAKSFMMKPSNNDTIAFKDVYLPEVIEKQFSSIVIKD
jgi:hypothetical protein